MRFADRHIGPGPRDLDAILDVLGVEDLDELVRRAVPAAVLDAGAESVVPAVLSGLPPALGEAEALADLRALAERNELPTPLIGLGYHGTVTPPVLLRNILENPAWYTAYTPYQPEISQGRLEMLLNFQTMVADLTGMDIANSSMLDEATSSAEAMTLLKRANRTSRSSRIVVDTDLHPQTRAVIATRAEPLGIDLVEVDLSTGVAALPDGDFFGLLAQQIGSSGRILDLADVITAAHDRGALVAVGVDLLAAALITPPGEFGADVCFGVAQRFGVPMGFGGPHAGFLAVTEKHVRALPGRLVGVSVDADGNPALRLALQTREQHIRRERATSNICTAQVLPAVMAAAFACFHGAEGITAIAERVHSRAVLLAGMLAARGRAPVHGEFFDTLVVPVPGGADDVLARGVEVGVNLRRIDGDHVGITVDETTVDEDLLCALVAVTGREEGVSAVTVAAAEAPPAPVVPERLRRTSGFLAHEVFRIHRTETAMMRYLRRLSDKDLALDRTMIPLGSCTMKLNAAAEMIPITWDGFAAPHPFAPADQTPGFHRVIADLEEWLAELTGYDAVSLQPNAGSQGEYAGLLAIRAYHRSRGDTDRDVCLIPASAHGTNAASAVMAGMRVVVVACRDNGDVDLDDLRATTTEHADRLAAIMVTYPSTHGVYEERIRELCDIVHDAGGQVYIDGANMNALVGLGRPGAFGGDVSHLNLHKTFAIPHGGGGPGVGPVAVRGHLAPFLPGHPLVPGLGGGGPVSGAPWGSASVLPISWAYIRMMGADGLRRASAVAIASANYIAHRLAPHFPILYTGPGGFVAHECIVDLRPLITETGVTIDDVAKRLADYGFHAPTMSFPVPNTLMIEPTESEGLAELDAFCDAMIAIRGEIDRVGAGGWPVDDNPLRGAPHTAECLVGDWDHPYTRAEAVFPLGPGWRPKVFPPVRRIDAARGDRNLACSCPSVEEVAENRPRRGGTRR